MLQEKILDKNSSYLRLAAIYPITNVNGQNNQELKNKSTAFKIITTTSLWL